MADEPQNPPITDKREETEGILGAFRTRQEAGPHPERGPIPGRLHHYTTVEGLQGIIREQAIWASDVRYMNDASELTYAANLIAEVVSKVVSGVEDETLRERLPDRPGFANTFEYGARPFVACFCEQEDLLSQWRGYDSGETGFSLGLDLSSIAMTERLPPRTFIRKVIYDEAEQRSAVADVVRIWIDTIQEMLNSGSVAVDDLLPYPAIWALQEPLAEHHLCFKHPTFQEEQEWRLIKLVDVREELRSLDEQRRDERMRETRAKMMEMGVDMPEYEHPSWAHANAEGVEIKFRKSSLGLVPYVELPLRDFAGIFTNRLPLWQVVQGPTANPDLSLESLRLYLESRGYGFHTEVRGTGIPLRR